MKPISSLFAAAKSAGLPYTQLEWPEGKAPSMPYLVIVPDSTSNIFSDGTVTSSPVNYLVELYTKTRDVATELNFQGALNDAGIGWQRYHTSDSNGPAVIAVYQMTLIEQEPNNG